MRILFPAVQVPLFSETLIPTNTIYLRLFSAVLHAQVLLTVVMICMTAAVREIRGIRTTVGMTNDDDDAPGGSDDDGGDDDDGDDCDDDDGDYDEDDDDDGDSDAADDDDA